MATESPLKTKKNAIYFMSKALFALKIFRFLSARFDHVEKQVVGKVKLISKFMTSHSGKQTVAMHTLPNISRSKNNQTVKFGLLIEYNMRHIFLEKSYTKWGGKTIPRSISKKTKLSVYLNEWSKLLYSLFLFNVDLRATEIY